MKPELERLLRRYVSGQASLEDIMRLVKEACKGDARCINEVVKTVLAVTLSHEKMLKNAGSKERKIVLDEILERMSKIVAESKRRKSTQERRRGGRG